MLNGVWELSNEAEVLGKGKIPGSVYSVLLENQKMEDPYYRMNELEALSLMEKDYEFSHIFSLPEEWKEGEKILLHFDGLDTLATILVNGEMLGKADNMHRVWEYDITSVLKAGENTIIVHLDSPTKYIEEKDEVEFVGGSYHAMKGFAHIRKAHCMFGWDWGPRLPDAGIWRDVYLLLENSSRIEDVHIRQVHEDGEVFLTVAVKQSGDAVEQVTLTAPNGEIVSLKEGERQKIENPQLWWPRGYGEQPLYTVEVKLLENETVVDSDSKRIGLRTMTVAREKDEWGESFAHCVNGVQVFAMGADYIPEDNILSRVTPERTRELLERCVFANFNCIRVWGGGYYPDDFFYDICDELGLLVWQDFMFACANYLLSYEFEQNIKKEFEDNVKRIRHHASLALWCGNNEMEDFQTGFGYNGTLQLRADYIKMFEYLIPAVLRETDPDTFYWPSSPSSGGGFDKANDPNHGDVHYWDVWHGAKPFTEYRKFFFRYCSEFGFQSFPSKKTVDMFALPEEQNIFSRVMEMHQRNEGANGKIMQYISQTYLYPREFDVLFYASQLLQAEAMKYGVEHWRRNRNRCMGAIYWQLNDIWPVASWASIDYYGRLKALHYFAKRFFAPVMISCEEIGETADRISVVMQPSKVETSIKLNVANETREIVRGEVRWALRDSSAKIVEQGKIACEIPALTSLWLEKKEFIGIDYLEYYVSYEFVSEEVVMSEGTVLFTTPKHYHFKDPELSWVQKEDKLIVKAKNYVRSVEIEGIDGDVILSDNYFDMNAGEKEITILEGEAKEFRIRSVYDIR